MTDHSRDPSDYRPDPDGHYSGRVRERDVPMTAVIKAVRDGKHTEKSDRRVECRTTYLMDDYVVVIDPKYNYYITAYRE
jgi:hypothetical protein